MTTSTKPANPPTAPPAIVPALLWGAGALAGAGDEVGLVAGREVVVTVGRAADGETPEDDVASDELDELELEEVLLDEDEVEDVLEDADPDGKKSAATLGFDDRNPAVTSPVGQPVVPVHGFVLQQPIKGGTVKEHVYHSLPAGHS